MHLLDTSTYKLHVDGEWDSNPHSKSVYAILSHRWETTEPEIKFQDLDPRQKTSGVLLSQYATSHPRSFKKITGACDRARGQGLHWIWIDTCCINKSNAVEETESISSMFKWYNEAKICYAYIGDVVLSAGSVPSEHMFKIQDARGKLSEKNSVWFERGWTLQELLASQQVEFCAHDWTSMGTKHTLITVLRQLTGIEEQYLGDPNRIQQASVATKMSWMVGRETGRIEDIAYSMLGIFGVTMEAKYGEGRKAFMRLQKTIIEETPSDESIFAWTIPRDRKLKCLKINPWQVPGESWGVLAPSPDCFADSKDVIVTEKPTLRPGRGYFWTQQGIQFEMSAKSGTEATGTFGVPRSTIDAPLNCWKRDRTSGKTSAVLLSLEKTAGGYQRVRCNEWKTKQGAKPGTTKSFGIDQGPMAIRPVTVMHRYV